MKLLNYQFKMKEFYAVLMIFCASFIFGQINIDEIKKNVSEDPQKFYYQNLETFKTNPSALSQEQLNYIYYGNNYVVYGFDRGDFNKKLSEVSKFAGKKISKKLSSEVLNKALSLYELNPLNKTLLNNLALLYGNSGDHEKRDFHLLQYQLLVETIGKSGSGLLEETPIVVTNFQDKFLALEQFSKVFASGISFKTKQLEDGSWLDIFKNGIDLYFIKTVHHKDMFK